jgi:hypothetical protein
MFLRNAIGVFRQAQDGYAARGQFEETYGAMFLWYLDVNHEVLPVARIVSVERYVKFDDWKTSDID